MLRRGAATAYLVQVWCRALRQRTNARTASLLCKLHCCTLQLAAVTALRTADEQCYAAAAIDETHGGCTDGLIPSDATACRRDVT